MNIVWSWLEDWIALDGSVDQVVETLIQAGVEVSGVTRRGADIANVVTARILEREPHPNADRLSVCKVDDGSGVPRRIVCGAKNYVVGDVVPLALPGAVLPGDLKIKVGKLRGVESEGMLCSGKELGLADDADGLLILSRELVPGTPIKELFPPETVIAIEVTPNRPDQLSHRGLARVLSAYLGWPMREPTRPVLKEDAEVAVVGIELRDAVACPLYAARRIQGVRVAPSPDWMRRRLELAGLRPINNIVDITNYVLHDIGSPLHAFDAAKMEGEIVVRSALAGETLEALDGTELKLADSQLVIADATKPAALAGVMGGKLSGVTESTTEIFLESAWFFPKGIRASARLAGLSSDSSYRFERGADPGAINEASALAAGWIAEIAGGKVGAITLVGDKNTAKNHNITLRSSRVKTVLGLEISDDDLSARLGRLGFVANSGAWVVPTWRRDVLREIDLIEEIAHLVGLEQIPSRLISIPAVASEVDHMHDVRMRFLYRLAAIGFLEVRNLTLQPGVTVYPILDLQPGAGSCAVSNPLSVDNVVLRRSLLPGMLANLVHNLHAGVDSLRFSEFGQVYWEGGQRAQLALVMTGSRHPAGWSQKEEANVGFHDLKGALEQVLERELQFEPFENASWVPLYNVKCGNQILGLAGGLAPSIARGLDARYPVWAAEIGVDRVVQDAAALVFQEFSRLPAITRDVAFLAPRTLQHAEVMAAIPWNSVPLLAKAELFDLFEDATGEKIAVTQKSMAYSFTYRSKERTLTAEEANQAHATVRAALQSGLGVTFRE